MRSELHRIFFVMSFGLCNLAANSIVSVYPIGYLLATVLLPNGDTELYRGIKAGTTIKNFNFSTSLTAEGVVSDVGQRDIQTVISAVSPSTFLLLYHNIISSKL